MEFDSSLSGCPNQITLICVGRQQKLFSFFQLHTVVKLFFNDVTIFKPSTDANFNQKTTSRTVARKSSIGGLRFCGGIDVCAGEAWHQNLTKIQLIYNVSYFNLGRAWSFVWGAKPTKVATGLTTSGGSWRPQALSSINLWKNSETRF